MTLLNKLLTSCFLLCFLSLFSQNFEASFTSSIGTEFTSINISIDSISQIAHFKLEGPSDKYFAFGFGESKMAGSYAIVCNSSEGDISERKFTGRNKGIELIRSISNLTQVEVGGRITFEFDRPTIGMSSDYFSFNFTDDTEIDFIYALGVSNILQFHGASNRGITKLSFQKIILGIGQNKEIEGVSIFPNPVRDKLSIRLSGEREDTNINVLDGQGKIVLSQVLKLDDDLVLDVTSLKTGLYILSIKNTRVTAGMSFQKE